MDYFKQTLRELQVGIVFFGIVNVLIGMWFPEKMLDYVFGGALGTVAALVMSENMARAVARSVVKDEKHAEASMRLAFIVRYLIATVVLAVACVSPWVNPIATFFGIFSIKFATYLTPLVHKINLKINPKALETDGSEAIEEEISNDSADVTCER